MKSIRLIALCLVAALLATSCTKESGFGDNGSGAISFSTKIETPFTRGTPVINEADIPNMVVYGYYTGDGAANNWVANGATATPTFANGIFVTNNSGSWSYTGTQLYWAGASDAHITFFSYSPQATADNGISVSMGNGGLPTFTYTVPTDCSKQPDFMVSALKPDLNKSNGSGVQFNMEHVLTCVGFQIAGGGEQIKSISVTGVRITGTLTPGNAAEANPVWSNLGTATTTYFSASLNYDSGEDYYTATSTMSNNLLKGDGYLMMIP